MKKKLLWSLLIAVLLLAVLFVPIPGQDGGTKTYSALTYKVVKWNRLVDSRLYSATRVYRFPDNFRSLDALWAQECPTEEAPAVQSLTATVVRIENGSVLVRPALCEDEQIIITFPLEGLPDIGAQFRSQVKIYYDGNIMETSPAQIRALDWELTDTRTRPFGKPWLSESATDYEHSLSDATLIISEVYRDCFFAGAVNGSSVLLKVNGQLDARWQVGDYITLTCENILWDEAVGRVEADLISIEPSDWHPDPDSVLYG